MKDTVATASRDILAIKRREYSHYAYRGLQLVAQQFPDPNCNSVLLYPVINNESALSDLLNRLSWYLPERSIREDVKIQVPTDIDIEAAHSFDGDAQPDYETKHLPTSQIPPERTSEAADKANKLLIWDADSRSDLTAIRNLAKVEIVDPTYYSGVESYNWGTFTDELRSPKQKATEKRLRELERKSRRYERSYVFATGPSLSRAWEFDFEAGSVKIVCNSIVKNDELLDHIDPDVLVFADPVFHFGPSEYAETFRQDAVETIRKYDCLAVVPSRYLSLLSGHHPGINVAGLESVDVSHPLFPTHEDPRTMATGNIMTWFMLPIASSLTKNVNILGADGREESESYFWEHNEDAQYNDELMKTVVDCHPSFFRDRVYTDYYEQHCRTLSSFLDYGESRGIEYNTLTESHIGCLQERTVPETKPMVD